MSIRANNPLFQENYIKTQKLSSIKNRQALPPPILPIPIS
jgi:hypothetical protein